MSFWTDIGKWYKKWFGTLTKMPDYVDSYLDAQTGASLTGAQQEANAFTASEAEKTRLWQEQMRATNYQSQVADMQAAGINPAMMYGSGGSSSTPSGPSAASVAPSSPASLSEVVQLFFAKAQMNKLKAETENIQSETSLNEASAEKTLAETGLVNLQKQYYPRLTEAQISQINADVAKLEAEVPYLKSAAWKQTAEVGFINAQKLLTDKNTEWYDKLQSSVVTLNEAKANEADSARLKNVSEQLWIDFQHAYAAAYGSSVPSGSIVALLSYLRDTWQVDNSIINKFIDAIRESKTEIKLDNHTTNELHYPSQNTSTHQEYPYYPPNH